MVNQPLLAWHFLPADRRLTHGDGRRVESGLKFSMPEEHISMAGRGFHASVRALDALHHAPGPVVCRVEMEGRVMEDASRVVASERTVLWLVDASRTLHEFCVWCTDRALKWVEAPDPRCVEALARKREWLTGTVSDEDLGNAWAQAFAAVRDAPDHRQAAACLAATYASTPVSDNVEQSARDCSQEAINLAMYEAEADGVLTEAERREVRDRVWGEQNRTLEALIQDLVPSEFGAGNHSIK